MRWVALVLIALIGLLQYRLWIGDGSVADLRDLRARIAETESELERLQTRNSALAAEVEDLRGGLDAIEERARSELGMIRRGEVYLQVVEKPEGPRE